MHNTFAGAISAPLWFGTNLSNKRASSSAYMSYFTNGRISIDLSLVSVARSNLIWRIEVRNLPTFDGIVSLGLSMPASWFSIPAPDGLALGCCASSWTGTLPYCRSRDRTRAKSR